MKKNRWRPNFEMFFFNNMSMIWNMIPYKLLVFYMSGIKICLCFVWYHKLKIYEDWYLTKSHAIKNWHIVLTRVIFTYPHSLCCIHWVVCVYIRYEQLTVLWYTDHLSVIFRNDDKTLDCGKIRNKFHSYGRSVNYFLLLYMHIIISIIFITL